MNRNFLKPLLSALLFNLIITFSFSQNNSGLELRIFPTSEKPVLKEKIGFGAYLINTTSQPVTTFKWRSSDLDWFSYMDDWKCSNGEEKIKMSLFHDGSQRKIKESDLTRVMPGDSVQLRGRSLTIENTGDYKIQLKHKLDMDGIKEWKISNGAVRKALESIPPYDLTSNLVEFTIEDFKITEFQTEEITEEELNKKKIVKEISEAFSQPEEVYRLNLKAKDVNQENLDKLVKLKNLRDLTLAGLTGEMIVPAAISQLPLRRLSISAKTNIELPADFAQLKSLKNLSLTGPLESLPPFIYELENLEFLGLFDVKASTVEAPFGNLVNIKSLSIVRTQITAFPETMKNLNKLERVSLQENKLTAFPNIFQAVNLTDINLSKNNIPTVPAEIKNLIKLKTLDLSSNMISDLPDEFCDFENLTLLRLSNNKITALPENIGNMEQMKSFYVDENKIKDFPASMIKLQTMMHFSAEGCSLEKFPLFLTKTLKVKYIYLDNNNISEIPYDLFDVKYLKVLEMANNKVTKIPLVLSEMRYLKSIYMQNNPLSQGKGFKALKKEKGKGFRY